MTVLLVPDTINLQYFAQKHSEFRPAGLSTFPMPLIFPFVAGLYYAVLDTHFKTSDEF